LRVASTLMASPGVAAELIRRPEAITDATKLSIRVAELQSAVDELRSMLDNSINDEARYQSWLNDHSWIFGADFMDGDAVRGITARDNVDMLLPRHVNGYREIIELKIPSMKVLLYDDGHRNHYFSSDVSKAIGQVDRYLEKFVAHASAGLDDFPEVVAFHPVATIVIGRSSDWTPELHRALHGLNSRLRDISVITFDYLLKRGERLLEIVKGDKTS
jgi:hypothetical protein